MNKNERGTFENFKRSPVKSVKHTTYFSVYDNLFHKFKDKKIVFIEVGIFQGGSLFMWREYFGQQARIIGIDINPGAKKWEKDGFEIFIGSQSDTKLWENLFKKIGKVDIILDDGGHTFEQQIITAESVLPNIKDGGMLVVEDTHTSYMSEYGGISNMSFISYAKNMIDGINYRYEHFKNKKRHNKNVFSLQFFESFVIFNINSKLSSIESTWIENNGESMPSEYFIKSQNKISKTVYKMLTKNKQIKAIALMMYKIFMPLKTRVKNNLKLRKYFKY